MDYGLTLEQQSLPRTRRVLFRGDFFGAKLRFAIYEGIIRQRLRKHGLAFAAKVFEAITDPNFKGVKRGIR